ncbi:reverse transcriptase (RNA-dependent DNA polymerase) domain-containing protein [Hirsutella rhossiliensis]|uniref:Reverse transcriptase (RNA-dependent DNA polymerase) domain-containing protein n=1 Tax=Hirsutella rhossiliensis TaxID=111463 RepID=A0A9P8MRI1_9HYPO|nr:reverse transcriptase (RNA-dependent DNA polymerase) domain-containing protein [Hirsutella rhossiliensis]KAH0959829.1 reverse transcriptase (RNA-dependent DNA polymerase) domain-containing protein [Hirsutella rhossiliensis]
MNDHLKSRITPAPSSKAFHRLLLPFGLKVGPAWFQQFINAQLHDLLDRCASAYADDVLIYSDKEEDHWKDCQEVIWRLHQANLQGDIKKSRFNVTKVDYLGVLLEAGVGLSVDPRKVRSIQDWKFEDLRDRTAIRSFVGLCNFIRVFCYHASGVAEPLNRLLKKDVAFVMGPEQREAFDQLKRLAIEAPVLAFFRPELPTRLETDASRNATAGTMTPAERAYPIQDRELLAVVQSLEHFYPELLGQKFDVITDHEALVHFYEAPALGTTDQMVRLSRPVRHPFLYRPGRLNVVADALSRKTAELPTQTPDQDRPELDPNSVPKGAELVSLIRQENLLQDLGTHGTHLVVPAQTSDKQTFLQTALIRETHEPQIFAHAGQNKVIKLLQRDFYWPRMKEDIRRYIRNCHDCRRNKTPLQAKPDYRHAPRKENDTAEVLASRYFRYLYRFFGMPSIVMEAPYTLRPKGVEVTNQYLDQKLRFYVTKHQDNWSSLLPALDFAHNSSWHSSIDMAPLKVALGRDIRNPLSLPPTDKTAATGPAARARELVQTAQETQEDARNAATAAQERQKEQANRKRRPTDFAIGPFVILEERGHSYALQLPESYKMKNLFHADRLRKAADNPLPQQIQTPPPPEEINGEPEWEVDQVQQSRVTVLCNRLSFLAREDVKHLETAAQILQAIEARYKPSGSACFQELDKKYMDLTLDVCTDVMDFAEKLRQARSELLELDVSCQIGEPQFISKFLTGLGPAYEVFLTAFYQQHNLLPKRDLAGAVKRPAVSFEEAIAAAEHEEQSQKQRGATAGQALAMTRRDRDVPVCTHCKRKGHTVDKCFRVHPELKADFDKRHAERLKKKQDHRGRQEPTTSSTTPSITDIQTALAYLQGQANDQPQSQSQALANLAMPRFTFPCTIHLAPPGAANPVGVRDDLDPAALAAQHTLLSQIHILDTGASQHIFCRRGKFGPLLRTLVFLRRGQGSPFLPMGAGSYDLPVKGCWILGNGEHAAIVKGGQIVLTATVANATDEIRRHSDPAALVTSQVQNPNLRIWHERLAHLSERNIKRLQGMSTGLRPQSPQDPCEACAIGKIKEGSHRHSIRKGTWPLESLHIDICGPFPDTGYDGSRYWVAILDDYTQYGWTFSVATKDSLFPIFQAFLQKHETPTRRCLYVRMDLGGENRSTLLDAFCTDKAIEVIYAATEQHQQNGAIEVFHRVLSEKLNPTLIRSGLERKWWPYVLQSITYVRNLSPTAKLPITPMLGYQGHCNYILLDSSNRVFVSPNVIFVEHVAKPTVSERQPKRPKTGQILDQLIREEGQQAECPPRTLRNGNNRTADTASLYTPETSTALSPEPEDSQTSDSTRDLSDSSEDNIVSHRDESDDSALLDLLEETSPEPSVYSTIHAAADPTRPSVRRSTRQRVPPLRYGYNFDHAFAMAMAISQQWEDHEPLAFKQAMQSDSAKNWHAAMADEIQSLKALRGKWVYRLKRGTDGQIVRHKARFVAKGYEQQEGIDYSETFASVVRPESYRTIFAIAAAEDLEIEQMDVKTAFLYGDIDEEVYLEQPEGFEDGTGRVCRLKKAIYGLKQAPRIWFHTITKFLETLGYRPIAADVSVFVRGKSIIAIYVDDLLLTGACPCSHYLGIKVTRDRARRRIELSQRAYIEKILRTYNMSDCNPTDTPMAADPLQPPAEDWHAPPKDQAAYAKRVGSLMYAMLGTRSDICFSVGACCRHLANPTSQHQTAVKRIMRYLKGTIDYVLVLEGPLQPIQGYTDADFAADLHTRRSTSGFFYSLGSAAISWTSKRQPCVTLSSTEAEYVALTQSAQEAIWLRSLMKDLSHPQAVPTAIHEDNKGAIDLANNPQHHSRTKHISLKWHFIREKVAEGTVSLIKIEGTKQPADGLTKALPRDAFLRFRDSLGVKSD